MMTQQMSLVIPYEDMVQSIMVPVKTLPKTHFLKLLELRRTRLMGGAQSLVSTDTLETQLNAEIVKLMKLRSVVNRLCSFVYVTLRPS